MLRFTFDEQPPRFFLCGAHWREIRSACLPFFFFLVVSLSAIKSYRDKMWESADGKLRKRRTAPLKVMPRASRVNQVALGGDKIIKKEPAGVLFLLYVRYAYAWPCKQIAARGRQKRRRKAWERNPIWNPIRRPAVRLGERRGERKSSCRYRVTRGRQLINETPLNSRLLCFFTFL